MKYKFSDEKMPNTWLAALVVSMMLAVLPVKAEKAERSPVNSIHGGNKSSLKDSVKDSSSDFKKLMEILSTIGEEGDMSEHLSPVIGLTGSLHVKGKDFTTLKVGGKIYKECSIVYSPATTPDDKRPICVYINNKIVNGHDSESYWYRVDLNGVLEKAAILQGRYDDNGKPVKGSGVTVEQDINSPKVRAAFKTEFSYWTKEWLRQQKKSAAKVTKPEPVKP